jgi:capsular exopolysaccharide synthesis family protein
MNANPGRAVPAVFANAPPGPPPAQEAGAGTAWRHWRRIATLAIIGGIGTYILCQNITPLYTATATVMIDPREPKLGAHPTDPMSFIPPSEEDVRKNEIAVIRSRNLVSEVISDLNLVQLPEFNPSLRSPSYIQELLGRAQAMLEQWATEIGIRWGTKPENYGSATDQVREKAIDLFLAHLKTIEMSASRAIQISFYSEDPQRAALVANAVANRYIQQKVNRDVAEAQAGTQWLEAAIHRLNDTIRAEEYAIERVRSQQGDVPAADIGVLSEQMTDLTRQLVQASGESAAAEGRLAELKLRGPQDVTSLTPVLASPLIQRLQEQAVGLEAKLTTMSQLYGPQYPPVVTLGLQVHALHARINDEIKKITASYQSDLAVAHAKEANLRAMLTWVKADMLKAANSDVEVRALEREAKANKTVMEQMVARINDTMPELTNRARPDAVVISAAAIPTTPSYPPKLAMTAAAFVLFATAGAGLAVFRERYDDSIRSTIELRRMTNARVLGWLPAIRRAGRLQPPPTAVSKEPTSMFVENLRAVWFQIDHFWEAHAKTLLVTSAAPGEGKSSVSLSLARLLALSGRKVLLIDADLRYPGVHQILNVPRSPGLAEVVDGTRTFTDVLQVDPESGATVITAGEKKASPSELLQSPRLAQILADLSGRFDAVIIDTPPILAVHDAGILAPLVDMTVMVVRSGIRAATFMTALQRLQDLNVPLGGVILSKVETRGSMRPAYPDAEMVSRAIRKYYSG